MAYTTVRMWTTTLTKLRQIHVNTGEPMVAILDRLVAGELGVNLPPDISTRLTLLEEKVAKWEKES